MERYEFGVTWHVPNATDATNQVVFIAPFDCELVRVESRHRVASTSGTMDVVVAANGIAVASGTSLLTGTIDLAATADTKIRGTVAGANGIPTGQVIGLLFGGTLTNLLDLDVTIILRQKRLQAD